MAPGGPSVAPTNPPTTPPASGNLLIAQSAQLSGVFGGGLFVVLKSGGRSISSARNVTGPLGAVAAGGSISASVNLTACGITSRRRLHSSHRDSPSSRAGESPSP